MQTLLPSYYLKFRCVGGACKHSCCVDWEIDLDSDTLDSYMHRTDALGARIRASICVDESTHFCLCEDGRCSFLNRNNLCDIIIADGERALPEICREHPRFRNYYGEELVELGLGFACEAALACALMEESPFYLITDGEIDSLTDHSKIEFRSFAPDFAQLSGYHGQFLREKYRMLSLLSDTKIVPKERISMLMEEYGADPSTERYEEFFSLLGSLESLDSQWHGMLLAVSESIPDEFAINERFLRLFSYFVFRHVTAESLYSIGCVLVFAFYLCRLTMDLFQSQQGKVSFEEIVRLLSSEIEYSEDNTEALLDFCEQISEA